MPFDFTLDYLTQLWINLDNIELNEKVSWKASITVGKFWQTTYFVRRSVYDKFLVKGLLRG